MGKSVVKVLSLVVLLVFVFSLAACGSQQAPAGQNASTQSTNASTTTETKEVKNVTLKMWHIWPNADDPQGKAINNALAHWAAANPNIKIEADATENEAYKTKIKTAIAADDAPDIIYTWGAGFAKPFVDAGKVLALDDYLKDGTMDKLIPGTLTDLTYNGKVYGLPYTLAVGTFYVNKELFDQNGIKIPETYTELLAAVKAFRAKGITPMTVGEKDKWPGMFYYDILALRTAGAQACNDALNKKASFDQQSFTDAAAKLSELVNAKAFNDGCMGVTRDESEVAFQQGKIPMYFNGSWAAGSFEKDGSPVKGKIVAKKFPVVEGGKGDINEFFGGCSDTFMVNASTQYKDEAVKALKFICEDFSKESYLSGTGMPTWKMDVDTSKINPLVAQIVDLTKDAKGFVNWWDVYLEGADADTHKNLVQELYAGTKTPEQYSKEMQKINEKK